MLIFRVNSASNLPINYFSATNIVKLYLNQHSTCIFLTKKFTFVCNIFSFKPYLTYNLQKNVSKHKGISTERSRFTTVLQKAVFRIIKDGLSYDKRRSLRRRKTVFYISIVFRADVLYLKATVTPCNHASYTHCTATLQSRQYPLPSQPTAYVLHGKNVEAVFSI